MGSYLSATYAFQKRKVEKSEFLKVRPKKWVRIVVKFLEKDFSQLYEVTGQGKEMALRWRKIDFYYILGWSSLL